MANEDNLVMGPATIYIGSFGATEPADSEIGSVPASGSWTDVGVTMEGAEIEIEQEYKELEADQFVDVPGARLTKRTMKVKTSLAEPTLENLLYVLNDGTAGTGTGVSTYEPEFASSATQPTYRALIIDGYAPGGADIRRRMILRKVLSTDNVKFSYKKDEQTVFEVQWQAFYVDNSTAPFKLIDEDPA